MPAPAQSVPTPAGESAASGSIGKPAGARARTLLEVEEHLRAIEDTADVVMLEQEQEFLAELKGAKATAKEKRDRVSAFLAQCEGQAAIARAEIARLTKRAQHFETAVSRMEDYVLRVILQQPLDPKGRYPKLEGNLSSFAAQRNPPSITITDEVLVPADCKTVTVTMPALMWERVVDSLDLDTAHELLEVERPKYTVLKTLVGESIKVACPDWKKRLEAAPSVYADSVPGAAITAGTWRLVRS